MRIAYFGFDLYYDCLVATLQSGHEIAGIFTCEVDGVYEHNEKTYRLAEKYDIPITDQKPTANMLCELDCRLLISAGYYYKIPCGIVSGVNIHPSLLPLGRGPWPEPVTILKGLKKAGVTIHHLTDRLDEGDIILQREIPVSESENLETLTSKNVSIATEMLTDFLASPDKLMMKGRVQGRGEYWSEPGLEDMTFSVNDSYERIDTVTRAFYGYRCFMVSSDGKTEIIQAKCIKSLDKNPHSMSKIIEIDNGWLILIKTA